VDDERVEVGGEAARRRIAEGDSLKDRRCRADRHLFLVANAIASCAVVSASMRSRG
jgi:hypothetical protein